MDVVCVAHDDAHRFSKTPVPEIRIVKDHGVEGDAHFGIKVQHRSRVRANPDQPNLRQVHLIHEELFEEVKERGFTVHAADLGENITTRGIDLLSLPRHAILRIGVDVRLEVTGLRNPCSQIENFMPGLLDAVLVKGSDGTLIRKSGIMTVVRSSGTVKPGDKIEVELPPEPFLPLERV